MLRDLLESGEFKNSTANIPFAVGKDISGKTMIADIAKSRIYLWQERQDPESRYVSIR